MGGGITGRCESFARNTLHRIPDEQSARVPCVDGRLPSRTVRAGFCLKFIRSIKAREETPSPGTRGSTAVFCVVFVLLFALCRSSSFCALVPRMFSVELTALAAGWEAASTRSWTLARTTTTTPPSFVFLCAPSYPSPVCDPWGSMCASMRVARCRCCVIYFHGAASAAATPLRALKPRQ